MNKKTRHRWYVSPITRRILVVNVGALLVLMMGLLYTGQYERELISSELQALQSEGRLLASALSEGGVRETISGDPILVEDLSREMLRKLTESSTLRTVLFSKNGQLMLDSHQLMGAGGVVQMQELETPYSTWSLKKKASHLMQKVLAIFPIRLKLPLYPEKVEGIETYPDLIDALNGERSIKAWLDGEGKVLLVASLPVQKLQNVLGVVVLTRSGQSIEDAVHGVQMTVIELFLLVLSATIFLSIYQSQTIATPLLQLAGAAEKVSYGFLTKETIPDFSARQDEIGTLSLALRNMTEALAERMDTISNFSADVAHELKNPLASLKSAVETLALVKDAARQEKLLQVIQDDVIRMNRLITDIAQASRLDSELQRVEKHKLDIAVLLKQVVEAKRTKPSLQKQIELVLEEEEPLWVMGSDMQLVQVLENLIENARSFLEPQGKITIYGALQGSEVIIHVDNEGPPIPEKNLEAIFERFYSERPALEKFGQHSGLGLSISRQIVRAHKGVLFARNLQTPDGAHHGVRFTMIFPRVEEA